MKLRKRLGFTTRYVIVVGILLVAANVLLEIIDFQRSAETIKALINKNMLDLVNTAAALIDGDELGALTEDDVGSDVFNGILHDLSAFQDHSDIHFIYAVKQVGEREFVFTVDADPVDPGDFGEEIVVSEGLVRAGKGIACVDDAPLQDKWGNYYSAYSPVFDSSGQVAGIVGIDFDADWYDEQVRENTIYISFTSVLSVLGLGLVVILISRRVRKKFQVLNKGLASLSKNVDKLTAEISAFPGKAQECRENDYVWSDELEEVNGKIQDMQTDLRTYLEYLQTQAYVDALTKVRSSSAYHETLESIGKKIEKGTARFSVGIFDINSLKEINDHFGHEYGDMLIQNAAKAISRAFGILNTYRIGGDEFAVILEQTEEEAMREKMRFFDQKIAEFNAEKKIIGIRLAVSKGFAVFRPGQDTSYKEVFSRADKQMYGDKKAYYQLYADRRKKQ